jgi:predicted small metal-binding protein
MRDKKLHDELPAAVKNPSVQSSKNDLNPPAPSTGTADEKREQVSQSDAEAWHPDSKGAGDVRFTSYPQNEAAQNPAAWENASPHGDRSLSCADCDWSVSGKTEEEVLGYMRAHARQVHGKNEFTSAELESARRAIHKRAA